MKILFIAAWIAAAASAAYAQKPAAPVDIHGCKDKRHYSDKPNPECMDQDQNLLNQDGSKRGIASRPKTEDEKAEEERKRQEDERERKRKQAELRTDSNLLSRFPDKATHDKARRKALADQQISVGNLTQRKALLDVDRKKLADEAEFYVGKTLPPQLKSATDANDAALSAVGASIANQQQEIERINRLYDEELEHLRKLWSKQKALPP